MTRSTVMNNEKVIATQMERIKEICSQPLTNRGKGLDEVAERQRRRKILALRESCKRALWFTDSFNIDIISLLANTRTSNEQLTIDISPIHLLHHLLILLILLLQTQKWSTKYCTASIGSLYLMSFIINCR